MLQRIKHLAFFILAISMANLYAKGKFEFVKETHDFGVVTEGEKPTYVFKFKNIGDEPIILSRVKPSCGCTSPSFTKDPVLPGAIGEIKVMYNSNKRIGSFNKSITISSNAEPASKVIYIKGLVVKPATVAHTEMELKKSPVLTVSKKEHYFGEVAVNKPVVYTFTVTNTGKNPLKINRLFAGCHCVTYEVEKQEIRAGESGTITITYQPRVVMKNSEDLLIIQSNDLKNPYIQVKLKANVVESLGDNNMMFQNQGGGF
ncbi:MAG: DUF1573 domain-containing protein [Cytophagales bacterium]|nr:DUF1573 domain-containing protein [Cytophagales bacterium]